ncbi:MAG: tRNA 2-thiouridine(34) synthase MnmA [Nitrospira sp.]|jgi:tRNA-specific 2-thiouridylase|nr:tRNA 2-thiouridine(34) synthase MnmA [Nitrospira sp.]MDH4242894.1 tRNA 2-thiouridine(34) synthase MnmA [Nitrospira sp.]MDH4356230.1 tRNA 2-thiouridine(34) synthase MnmA [Nitrospira sp.]MDH5318120.1 tRNA 2-thiouridine(34) synthase MnmA [Nitrospira sp.]
MNRPSVLLGMSGGVDSSVAAALLVRQGYNVHGITLQVWEHEDDSVATSKKWQERGCCKVGLAKHVAQRLNIPHNVLDARESFRAGVIDDFLSGYTSGTTPNPCVRCNERVKIRTLIDLATTQGFDYVATGHYARLTMDGPIPTLSRAVDHRKDQTYFLYRLHRQWLRKLLFPVGELLKSTVWEEAEALGLPPDELKESQEICFVTQGDYRTFIQHERPTAKKSGLFINEAGVPLGEHDGIAFYTPGQRRGLGIATGQRLYVQQVNPFTNTVLLGPEESLYKNACTVSDLNLLDPRLTQGETEVQIKLRYATPATPATVSPLGTSGLGVRFHHPQRAISPGQSAVFYDHDAVLGGGIIQPS